MWVLGIEPRFFGRAVCSLKHPSIIVLNTLIPLLPPPASEAKIISYLGGGWVEDWDSLDRQPWLAWSQLFRLVWPRLADSLLILFPKC